MIGRVLQLFLYVLGSATITFALLLAFASWNFTTLQQQPKSQPARVKPPMKRPVVDRRVEEFYDYLDDKIRNPDKYERRHK